MKWEEILFLIFHSKLSNEFSEMKADRTWKISRKKFKRIQLICFEVII